MSKIKLTYKSVFAILFSLVVLTFFVTICERYFRAEFFFDYVDKEAAAVDVASENNDSSNYFDWSKLYPFEETEADVVEVVPEQPKVSIVDEYINKVDEIETGINYYSNNLLFGRMKIIELNAFFNKAIGMKLISGSDDIVCLADGNLAYYPMSADETGNAESISGLSDFLKEKGIGFIYVQAPSKVDPENNYLPGGIDDYDNEKADSLLSMLDEKNVNNVDLRSYMKAENMNYAEAFYRTDHHWKTETGFWASGIIAENLSKISSIPYEKKYFDSSQYNKKVYENYIFGSLGKSVTLAYADPEDISVYFPKFPTSFTVDYYRYGIFSGPFEKSLLRLDALSKIDYYNYQQYAVYMHGVTPLVKIENHNADNNKRILFIGDSFSHCVVPYLAMEVEYLDKLDLRYFNGSVRSYIEKTKPDAVVMMYYPASLNYYVNLK